MKPFVINRSGRLVFPANFFGELDFTVLDTLEQFTAVIERDFEAKAPTGTDILHRVESGSYPSRFELLRDLGQNLFWVNRYSMTMFDKRPMRWRDVPRHRDDVFLPVLTPWEDRDRKVAAVERAFHELPSRWVADTEDRIFALLFDVFRHKLHHATELPAIKPTVAEFLAQPDALTFVMPDHDPDHHLFPVDEIFDADEEVPELEALTRWAMVLHNLYPWDGSRTTLRHPADIGPDDFVVTFHPRNRDVMAFIDRAKQARDTGPAVVETPREPVETVAPRTPYPPVRVREAFAVRPALEALAVVRGEHVCDNVDVIRNASFSWSPMSAEEIGRKTGIAPAALHVARAAAPRVGRRASGARRSPAGRPTRSARSWSAPAPATARFPPSPAGSPASWGWRRPTRRWTWSRPVPGCPTGSPRRSGRSRRSGGPCCWCASRSSPTRSGAPARRE